MFKRIVVFTAIVVAFPSAAGEAPEQGQWLLSILAARTETPAEHGLESRTSPAFAVGYGLTDSVSAEISYQQWAADNGDGNTRWVSGMWSLPKGTPRLQPYVVLGGGSTQYQPDASEDFTRSQWFGGVGAFGDLGARLSWRADVRAVRTNGSSALNPYAQAGLTLFFGDVTPSAPPDTDGDGVPDPRDECPGTPLGVVVDASGCALPPPDADRDGVPNDDDECPATPAGERVDEKGCPADDDADGVPNSRDECPDTPRGTSVDESGCPPCQLDGTWIDSSGRALSRDGDGAWLDSSGTRLTEDADGVSLDSAGRPVRRQSDGVWMDSCGRPVPVVVLFGFDDAEVRASDAQTLRSHAAFLRANGALSVRVEGHCDAAGNNDYNLVLGERRANAVRDLLLAAGIERHRVTVVSYGEDRLIAESNDAANRRAVVIYVESRRVIMVVGARPRSGET